ncbi:hypothetical protein GJ744_004525 [Endocarpon pusillum]|uniref:Rrn9 domain-containing protein n=1 Tax=Endocarpon pusillum TaxID=364733 RepID=A0A8H7ARL6_9EURO|nr:hypothetical protein GJ744_004525 [Endocarpon pusillum]
MSSTAASDDGYPEPEMSHDRFQSAQPIQAPEAISQLSPEQEADAEDAELVKPTTHTTHHDSDSDEYLPPQPSAKRKGKKRVAEYADPPPSSSQHDLATEAETASHDRPNRFHGPPSTWLSWTRSERELVRSLDQERSENLSAHLYVAHKIKQQARSVQRSNVGNGKARTRSTEGVHPEKTETEAEQKPFTPPKVWTAWPMPPEQVPRVFHTTGILDGDDAHTIKGPRDVGSSAELEACLLATVTRVARERWTEREWEWEDNGVEGSEEAAISDQDFAIKNELPHPPRQYPPPPPPNAREIRPKSSTPPPVFFSSQPLPQKSPSPPVSSHPKELLTYLPSSSSSSPSSLTSPPLPPHASLRPVPLADDERARILLLPATRRIISKLDDLLMGLHRARRAYATKPRNPRSSGSETHTQTETEMEMEMEMEMESASSERSKTRSRSRRRRKSATTRTRSSTRRRRRRRRTRFSHGSAEQGASDTDRESLTTRKRKGVVNSRAGQDARLARLGLRDWSGLLGMAALTGWDEHVVFRAGERCAALFEEGMAFRRFYPPGGVGGDQGQQTEKKGGMVEEVLLVGGAGRDVMDEDEDEPEQEQEEADVDVMDTDHDAERDHAPSTAAAAEDTADSSSSASSAAGSAPTTTTPHVSNPTKHNTTNTNPPSFPCPHPPCRHHTKHPFLTRENLSRHLNQQHQFSPWLAEPAAPSAVDAIFCPVTSCARHRHPFSRGNLLYQHVRRVHPELDLARVKEGQKERRRSVSRGRMKRTGRRAAGKGVERGEEEEDCAW